MLLLRFRARYGLTFGEIDCLATLYNGFFWKFSQASEINFENISKNVYLCNPFASLVLSNG